MVDGSICEDLSVRHDEKINKAAMPKEAIKNLIMDSPPGSNNLKDLSMVPNY